MRWTRNSRLLGLAVAALAVVVAGCTSDPEVEQPKIPPAFNFRGEVRLSGSANVTGDLANCSGVGHYVDMYKGATVLVTDQDAKPLAMGSIIGGGGTNYYREVLDECVFAISVLNVPRAKGYFVVVARQPARPITLAGVVANSGRIRFDANPPLVRSLGNQ